MKTKEKFEGIAKEKESKENKKKKYGKMRI